MVGLESNQAVMDTQGFGLYRASDESLLDNSGNLPVRGDDQTAIAANGSANAEIAPDARATLEPPPPVAVAAALTVAAVGAEGMEAVPSADNGNQYTMTFRVASTKAIDDIGTTTSYVLLHIATEGDEALDDINSFITSSTVAVNDDNTQSTLTYVVTFTNTVTQTRITDGFTLGRNGASALQDDDGLDPVKGGTTNNGGAIEDGVRIDDDDTAVAARDTDAPAITVASSTIEPSNAGRTYTIAFAVAATEAVASIGSTSSYVLLSTVSSGVAIDFSSVSGVATANAANTTATVMYTVMLDDYADVRRVSGFSLGRRDASALLDASNNEPVKGGGTSGAGAIEAGLRIDDDDTTALALRDTTGVTITIDAANVVATTPGLMYTVTYELSASEAIAALADMGAYEVTRNGSGNEPTGSITLEVMANDDMTTAIITYSAEFGSDQYADVRITTGWTLGLSSDAFIDAFGNEATLAGNATALRDTDAPQITIESASLSVENTTFTAIFVVEANENVETLDEAGSYALYRYVGGVASLVNEVASVGDDSNNESTTLTYVVGLESNQAVMDTQGFGLYRASDVDTLLDDSGNLPVRGDDQTAIAANGSANAEIAPDARATLEPPPPVAVAAALTVAAVGAEGMEAVPSADNGNQYTMTFRVASTKAIDDIGTTTSYVLLHIASRG